MITFKKYIEEGSGLWANIHKKRKEGRPMRKSGSKGAPTKADFKSAIIIEKKKLLLINRKWKQSSNIWP